MSHTIASLKPAEAWHKLQTDARSVLIDVRDPTEFAFVGHPMGAINIPWKAAPDGAPNPGFLDTVRERYPTDTPLLLLCRSGQRSLEAARALAAAGFQDLTNVAEGFEGPLDAARHRGNIGGWRWAGLPWEQS